MTDTGAQGAVLTDGRADLVLTSTGALRRASALGLELLLHPATELEDGLGGLWLRERAGRGWQPVALTGTSSRGAVATATEGVATGTGDAAGLRWTWRLSLLGDRAGWRWDVRVTNGRSGEVEVDLLHAQDLALSDPAVLEANRLYPSQYLDLTPVEVPGHGAAVAVRQNMPGPTAPWGLVGCLTPSRAWGTDALQLLGRGLPEGAPWPGLAHDLPGARLQHEHAAALVQSEAVRLAPGESWRSGFFVVLVADHPAATSDADAAAAHGVRLDHGLDHPSSPAAIPARSLVGTGTAYLPVRDLTEAELEQLVPGARLQVEVLDGAPVSWFTEDGDHVVTAAKQRAVLRPHGQVLRPLERLLPDPHDVTTTVWMDGGFCSHLTQGHAALGRILSSRQTPLSLGRVHGLRVAVDLGDGWQLLGTPSLWCSAVDGATWWYDVAGRRLRVAAPAPAGDGTCRVEVTTLEGPPLPALVLLGLDWSGAPGEVGALGRDGTRLTIAAPRTADARQRHPDARLEVALPEGAEVGDDGPLFEDGRSRGEPVVTVRLPPRARWAVELLPLTTGERSGASGEAVGAVTGWAGVHDVITVEASSTGHPSALLSRVGQVSGWYAHDALVHYLSPRGLEQHTGGAWGTRDVCQGPVGLLRAWSAHEDWRALLLTVFRGQHERGDWPQAFDFLPAHRQDVVGDAHGDVVYWPLLALGQYLLATGDHDVLAEEVRFTGDGAAGATAPVHEHVARALEMIASTVVPGTDLPAYGHGDWNDSLQPADPDLARRMISTWTVVLQAEALGRLAEGTEAACPQIARRARQLADAGTAALREHLLVDGVLAGYGVVGDDGTIRPLIHPRDAETGLTYSLLPMVHAIAGDLLTPQEARTHLDLVAEHLTGPDGARLFDRPVAYRGGPTTIFQRAEASSFFGREIGIMYVHAHLRYAEALARVGDGPGLLRALARAVPVGLADLVPAAAPRQANTYSSSSDAAFADRYEAERDYDRMLAGEVGLEAGWRVYSSGPGLFLEMLTQRLLGVRPAGDEVELDPVLDPALGAVSATLPVLGRALQLEIRAGERGHGVRSVRVDGAEVDLRKVGNPYREGGAAVPARALAGARSVVVHTG